MVMFQSELTEKLNSTTLDSLPKSLILCGEEGCGRHSFASDIAEKFNLEVENITEKLSFEYIIDIALRTTPFLYIIDCDYITQRDQNAILKLLEEPPKMAFICLIAEDEYKLLPTIRNRCIKWQFYRYTKEQLKTFTTNETVLKYARTPGQIKSYSSFSSNGSPQFGQKA